MAKLMLTLNVPIDYETLTKAVANVKMEGFILGRINSGIMVRGKGKEPRQVLITEDCLQRAGNYFEFELIGVRP